MIKRGNRDLLLVKSSMQNTPDLEIELRALEHLLSHVELLADIASVSEIIDFNRYRLIPKGHKVERQLRNHALTRPFVFLMNLN